MRPAAPRRAIRRRRPVAQGVSAALAVMLFTALGVYGLSQSTEAAAGPVAVATTASAAPVVMQQTDEVDSEDAHLVSELEARQVALAQSGREVSAELSHLVSIGKFYYPTQGELGSPWGLRLHPILRVWKMHEGVDIGAPCDAPVWAVLGGKVVGQGSGGDAGNYVKIDHGMVGGKHFVTEYMHMNKILVTDGQTIERGQQIGLTGSTGLSTTCHLHLALWVDNKNSDPAPYIKA